MLFLRHSVQGIAGAQPSVPKRYKELKVRVQNTVHRYLSSEILVYLRAIAHLSYSWQSRATCIVLVGQLLTSFKFYVRRNRLLLWVNVYTCMFLIINNTWLHRPVIICRVIKCPYSWLHPCICVWQRLVTMGLWSVLMLSFAISTMMMTDAAVLDDRPWNGLEQPWNKFEQPWNRLLKSISRLFHFVTRLFQSVPRLFQSLEQPWNGLEQLGDICSEVDDPSAGETCALCILKFFWRFFWRCVNHS